MTKDIIPSPPPSPHWGEGKGEGAHDEGYDEFPGIDFCVGAILGKSGVCDSTAL
jgi:hypothetical protein